MENTVEQNSELNSAPANSPVNTQPVDLKFHGKTGEFFGIWIVNILLSIVTLGIYSAWAKVRTNRYFYGNTELDQHSFSYLATPMQILKGRIIAVILFGGYFIINMISPLAGLGAMAILLIATPWLICASLRFRMRMTSYRNVRFNFTGTYGDAFINFLVLPIASVFTLYLLMPYALKRMDKFIVDNTYYGDRKFESNLSAGIYYKVCLIAFVMIIALMAIIFAVVGSATIQAQADPDAGFNMMTIVMFALYIIGFSLIQAFYQAQIRNHIFSETTLEDLATFESEFTFTSLAFLQVTNMLALLCTLGLAYPWVKIRLAQYAVARTGVNLAENKEEIVDVAGENQSALSEEVADVFDIDVALG